MTFAEENCCTYFYVLGTVHISEPNYTFIASSQQVPVHINYLCGLSDNPTVYNCLVVCLDCCSVMQNNNFCIKVEYWLRRSIFINQYASFSKISAFELLLFVQ